MKTLFTGLTVQAIGLVWDGISHMMHPGEIEGMFEPAHTTIFVGFAITVVGALLAYRTWRRIGSTS